MLVLFAALGTVGIVEVLVQPAAILTKMASPAYIITADTRFELVRPGNG